MKLKYDFVFQPLGDIVAAVSVGDGAQDYSGVIQLNETGAEIMQMMLKDTTVDEMVAILKKEYEAPDDMLRQAVEDLIVKLRQEKVLDE